MNDNPATTRAAEDVLIYMLTKYEDQSYTTEQHNDFLNKMVFLEEEYPHLGLAREMLCKFGLEEYVITITVPHMASIIGVDGYNSIIQDLSDLENLTGEPS